MRFCLSPVNFTVSLLIGFMWERERSNFSESFTKLWNPTFYCVPKHKFQFTENFRPCLPRHEYRSFPKLIWILWSYPEHAGRITQNKSTLLFFNSSCPFPRYCLPTTYLLTIKLFLAPQLIPCNQAIHSFFQQTGMFYGKVWQIAGLWPKVALRVGSTTVSFIFSPQHSTDLAKVTGPIPYNLAGPYYRTPWQHSSHKDTVATTSHIIIQLKFKTVPPVLPQSLLIRQPPVTQQHNCFVQPGKVPHVLLCHFMIFWLYMSSLQFQQ